LAGEAVFRFGEQGNTVAVLAQVRVLTEPASANVQNSVICPYLVPANLELQDE
jgi:hypothetical protein